MSLANNKTQIINKLKGFCFLHIHKKHFKITQQNERFSMRELGYCTAGNTIPNMQSIECKMCW